MRRLNRRAATALFSLAALTATGYATPASTGAPAANNIAPHHPRTLFYMSGDRESVQSFFDHRDKIDAISPTWYQLNAVGLVTGEPDAPVLAAAKAAHIQVFPLLAMFNKEGTHALVGDLRAQDEMNRSIVTRCKENGYDGIQFDIEDVMWTDRDGLSALVKRTADILHANGLQVQIAVVPNAPGHAGSTPFSRWIMEEWRLVFDLKALAQSVDLLCLMTYDQHTRWTMPGPVGGWLWTNENLDYALAQGVPREKLSLGIALYGYHWYTGDPGLGKPEQHPNATADYISQPNAEHLRATYGGIAQWDPVDHTAWFWFYHDQMREWIFYTDARGWSDRYRLAESKGLEGTCAWVLGEEDPAIWATIPARR